MITIHKIKMAWNKGCSIVRKIFSVGVGLASWIGIWVSIFTLQEMREERNLAYRPLIVFKDCYLTLSIIQGKNFVCYGNKPIIIDYDNLTGNWEICGIECINLGNFSAKECEIYWDINNLEYCADYLRNFPGVEFKKSVGGYLVKYNGSEECQISNNSRVDEIPYILPVSQAEENTYIQLPDNYIDIINLYSEILSYSKNNNYPVPHTFWDGVYSKKEDYIIGTDLFFKFELRYSDLQGVRYKEAYNVVIIDEGPVGNLFKLYIMD